LRLRWQNKASAVIAGNRPTRSRAPARERFEWKCNMTEATPSFVTALIAQRGNAAASRARLDAAIARADALEPALHAFTYRPPS
jgi:amidase